MKEMNCGFLRLPGGNFISGYDWKDTIGDPDKRPRSLTTPGTPFSPTMPASTNCW